MNFFAAQQQARRSTLLLGLLFLIAIALLIILSNLFLFEFLYFTKYSSFSFSPAELSAVYDENIMIIFSCIIFAFLTIGSFHKLLSLSSGGSSIAISLGGIIISRNSKDPDHKKVLNVVEEMAIASGIPVPQVYLLNEQGINAFAAGWKISNAVIGVTQGCIEKLSRDELQGVIAHEFSHIFNGDMKINLRLIAVLHSILMIGLMGRFLLRSLRYSRSSRSSKKGGGIAVVLVLGLMMTIIGYTGTFFGNWIKSLISRQREYLADASAVQFTRNNLGIANALKKIGGSAYGSIISYPSAEEYSHGYFSLSDQRSSFFTFTTHPPLKDRIKRLQPNWSGQYIKSKAAINKAVNEPKKDNKTAFKKHIASSITMQSVINNLDSIGEINTQQLDLAKAWKQNIPDFVSLYAQTAGDAQSLVLALLIDKKPAIADLQINIIRQSHTPAIAKSVNWLNQQIKLMPQSNDINIIDLALPSLRQMSLKQFKQFEKTLKKLIKADKKIDLKEWVIQRVLLQHLKDHLGLRQASLQNLYVIGSAKNQIELVLSLLCYIEHGDTTDAEHSFNLAKKSIQALAFKQVAKKDITLKSLNLAIDRLEQLKPPLKQKFLKAAVFSITHDKTVKPQSYELLRAIASCIDTPLPPILVDPAI